MGRSSINKLCRLNRALWTFCLGVLIGSPALAATEFPEGVEDAVLHGKWGTVIQRMDEVDVLAAEAHCRMVAAQACLATNRNNKALLLILTVKPEGVKRWSAWTERFVEDHPDSAVACYLRADALARRCDHGAAETWFTKAIGRDQKLALAWVGRGLVRAIGSLT